MCTGEWVDTKLYEVLEAYPQMKDWELVIWDDCTDDAELYPLGIVEEMLPEYKNHNVFYTDEDSEQVQLEGDVVSLGVYDPDWWEW